MDVTTTFSICFYNYYTGVENTIHQTRDIWI